MNKMESKRMKLVDKMKEDGLTDEEIRIMSIRSQKIYLSEQTFRESMRRLNYTEGKIDYLWIQELIRRDKDWQEQKLEHNIQSDIFDSERRELKERFGVDIR